MFLEFPQLGHPDHLLLSVIIGWFLYVLGLHYFNPGLLLFILLFQLLERTAPFLLFEFVFGNLALFEYFLCQLGGDLSTAILH